MTICVLQIGGGVGFRTDDCDGLQQAAHARRGAVLLGVSVILGHVLGWVLRLPIKLGDALPHQLVVDGQQLVIHGTPRDRQLRRALNVCGNGYGSHGNRDGVDRELR